MADDRTKDTPEGSVNGAIATDEVQPVDDVSKSQKPGATETTPIVRTDPAEGNKPLVSPPGEKGLMGPTSIVAVGLYLVALAVVLVQTLTAVWPTAGSDGKVPLLFGLFQANLTGDVRLIAVVAVAAAMGSYVSAATSFMKFVGNKQLRWSWAWWYFLLPISGSLTAIIFYFVLRGGLISSTVPPDSGSVYVIAALSGLAGMFSHETTDALHSAFSKFLGVPSPDPTKPLANPLSRSDGSGDRAAK
jgi:hypothetical protein